MYEPRRSKYRNSALELKPFLSRGQSFLFYKQRQSQSKTTNMVELKQSIYDIYDDDDETESIVIVNKKREGEILDEIKPPAKVDDIERTRNTAAGIGAGVIGLFFGGAIFATLIGLVAVHAAKKDEGVAGDTARAIGEAALEVQGKAAEARKKHRFLKQSKKIAAASDAVERLGHDDTAGF